MYKRYIHAPHLQLLDETLMQVVRFVETGGREGIGRLIIEKPPRHGKTLSVSKLFPPYFIGCNPDWRVINVGYGADLAEKSSRFARNLINSPVYGEMFPGVKIADDSASVSAWDVARHEGGMDAVGIGGAATGKGAHLLNLDDLIKNREQAESETWRNKIWDSYTDDLYTRLEPGGAVIVTGTRWHVDDHIGRLVRLEPDKWFRLRLPAIAEENDLLGRAVGEALWSERYPIERLLDLQRTLGEYSFNALYQQRPVPAGGGLFKRAKFNVIDHEPADMIRTVRFWDLALSSKTSADYSVGVQAGVTKGGRIVIMDVARFQADWDDVVPKVEALALKDSPRVHVGVETAFFHAQAVRKLLQRPALHQYSIRGYPVDTDKFTRALPFAARVGEDMVDVLRRSWTDSYIEELCSFPNGVRDDQVDASSGAYMMLDSRQPIKAEIRPYV